MHPSLAIAAFCLVFDARHTPSFFFFFLAPPTADVSATGVLGTLPHSGLSLSPRVSIGEEVTAYCGEKTYRGCLFAISLFSHDCRWIQGVLLVVFSWEKKRNLLGRLLTCPG